MVPLFQSRKKGREESTWHNMQMRKGGFGIIRGERGIGLPFPFLFLDFCAALLCKGKGIEELFLAVAPLSFLAPTRK